MGVMDNVRQCRVCKRLFRYQGFGAGTCPICRKEDDEMFTRVKTYLRDHYGSTLVEVSMECDVPMERIKEWLKEERLEYTGGGDTGLVCEKCGTPILSGRLCDNCRMSYAKAARSMEQTVKKPEEKRPERTSTGDRMRFLGKK